MILAGAIAVPVIGLVAVLAFVALVFVACNDEDLW